jgi:hypothetical protein
MKRMIAVVLLLAVQVQRAAAGGDVGYWPEMPTPEIRTFDQLRRYEKARKTSLGLSICGAIAAGVLVGYAQQVDRKAERVVLTGSEMRLASTGFMVPAVRPEQVEFQRRLKHKADGSRMIATALGVASIFGISLSLSLRF